MSSKEWLPPMTFKEAIGLGAYLVPLSAWILANPSIDGVVAAKAITVLLILAAPVLLVMKLLFGRIGPAEVAVSFSVGFILSGIVSILARLADLPGWTMILAFILCGLAFLSRMRRGGGEQSLVRQERSSPGLSASITIAAIILLLPLCVVLVRGALAGTGAFPPFIFYTDDATDLATIRSLLASPALPPYSLTFAGGIKPYHLGVLEAVANLVRLTGIKAHIAQFYLAFPIIEGGIIGVGWMLVRRLPRGVPVILAACLVVVAFNHNHGDFRISFKTVKAILQTVKHGSFAAEPTLNFLVVHLPTVGARMLAWLTVALMLYWERRTARVLSAVLVGCLAPLDPFYFISTGLILGLWCLYRSVAGRQPREILPAAAALIIGLLLMTLSGSGGSEFFVKFAPFACTYCSENTVEISRDLAFVAICGLGLAAWCYRHVPSFCVIWFIAALLLLLAANMLVLIYANQADPNFNWFRIASAVPMLAVAFTAAMLAEAWGKLPRVGRLLVSLVIVAATALSILRIPVVAAQVTANPLRGDDVVETTALAAAMQAIPLQNTVVVTNDLRYPVIDYRYGKKNTLISALFGHQCYFCNGDGEAELPGADQRLNEIRALSAEHWSAAIADLASKNHWTHFIVHKDWRYPHDLPLKCIFENERYAVYVF
ncbi:hypothetical protein ACFPL7_13660 [Dongia soli]|uniref:Glycosyltransferase RgtA/B/C/D-like domain-containing protein n=1 Tax=Dongia soli TaxID=600628 RepID=A0ABU5EF12_9PROT|nr:hypothetical protein [Dongia soli]MDY0884058.1 hypothetical protein [Dongia soli]